MRKLILLGTIAALGCSRRHDDTKAVETLADADPEARYAATKELASRGPAAKPAVEPLSRALSDDDASVRIGAAYALAAIGPEAAPAKAELLHALDDPNATVREAAAYALPVVVPGDNSVVPKLKEKSLEDPDKAVRAAATGALRRVQLATKFRMHEANRARMESRQNDANQTK